MDIEDVAVTDYGILGAPRDSHDPPTTLTKALHSFRIRCLWARIHATLYSDIARSSPLHPTYQTRLEQLRAELDEWRTSVPLVLPHQGEVLSMFSSTEWFNLCYDHTIIYLYRGQLTDAKTRSAEQVFFECAQAAGNICHGYRMQLLGKTTTHTWGALHTVFVAGLTYLHCFWASAAVRKTIRQDVVSATCTDCTITLVLIAQWHAAAAPYRDIFETLAKKTITMLVEEDRETAISAAFSSPRDLCDTAGLNQWMADISDGGMTYGFEELLSGLVSGMPTEEPHTGS